MRTTERDQAPPLSGVGGRLRLRWLVAVPTACVGGGFAALALVDRRAAPIALAGALLVSIKGMAWLLYLRRNRTRLRRHGFRW